MADDSIGALWVKNGSKGEYMHGIVTIGGTAHQIVVFKNTYKKAPNQPDWRILPSKPRGEAAATPEGSPEVTAF